MEWVMATAIETVMEWKYDIGNRCYWVADEIYDNFTAKFLETPDEIKCMDNNVVKLWRLAEYSAKDKEKAQLLLTLLRKHSEWQFWHLVDSGAKGQEGNTSYNVSYYVCM